MSDETNNHQPVDAQYRKLQAAEDGRKVAEYEQTAEVLRAKTERLRALRLARDAANPKPAAPARKGTKTAAQKQPKRAAPKLSEWLDGQQQSGRRS